MTFFQLKLGDFGSAKTVQSVVDSVRTTTWHPIQCTPLYAAPG